MSATPDAVTETIRADQLTPGRTVLIPMTESMETVTRVRVSGSYVTVHTNRTGPDSAYQWPAGEEISAVVAVPPAPIAAQPRYVLDVAGVLDLISQYAEACVEAATTGSPKAKDNALERREEVRHAIRSALTPVPDVEPEPRWGAGPLVHRRVVDGGNGFVLVVDEIDVVRDAPDRGAS